MSHNLLLEIGLEEQPARFLQASEKQLAKRMSHFLDEVRLTYDDIQAFSTPRRLAVLVEGLSERQADKFEHIKGPSKKIALNEKGEWTKAAEGFASGQGKTVDDIVFENVSGEEYVFVDKETIGKAANDVLKELPKVITDMTFPVTMRWGSNTFEYIRPIHWIVALLDEEIIPFKLLDVESGRISRGHRFLGEDITLAHANNYEKGLEEEYVIADYSKRKALIQEQIEILEADGSIVVDRDDDLLSEVTNLVEYPTAFQASFNEDFLDLPEEVLITSMRDHQRYFALRNRDGALVPHFISVRNGNDIGISNVAKGNEKVLTARLADAIFFLEEDQKQSIADYTDRLQHVTFHENLGTMEEKTQRLREISIIIGKELGLDEEELNQLNRAAEIAKFDLETLMVDEFPELQGAIGEIYALEKGEEAAVAQAIKEQYMPRTSGGELPESVIGSILAIADKIDNILMFYSAGIIPTSSNDPHGLRRQALGVLRIILDNGWDLDVRQLIITISEKILFPSEEIEEGLDAQKKLIFDFLKSRVRQVLEEANIQYDVIDAVLKSEQDNFKLLINHAKELSRHKDDDSFKEIMESLTRVLNLQNKAIEGGADNINLATDKLETASEKVLYKQIMKLKDKVSKEVPSNEFYKDLTELKPHIDDFFDNNMVMAKDGDIRKNRLGMLYELASIILTFASVDKLVKK